MFGLIDFNNIYNACVMLTEVPGVPEICIQNFYLDAPFEPVLLNISSKASPSSCSSLCLTFSFSRVLNLLFLHFQRKANQKLLKLKKSKKKKKIHRPSMALV